MPVGKFWTDDEIEQVRKMLDKGLTYAEIGERLGRTKLSVRGMCSREGINEPEHVRKAKKKRIQEYQFTKKEIAAIKDDYENAEMTTEEICQKYHFSRMVLYRLADENEFTPRKAGVPTWRRKLKIIDFSTLFRMYYEECETIDKMTERLKVNRRVIYRSLEHHGLERMPQDKRIQLRDEFKDTGKLYKQINEMREAQ